MKATRLLALTAIVALAGCGESEDGAGAAQPSPSKPAATATGASQTVAAAPASAAKGTTIVVRDSPFGRIVWGPKRQAVYIFQRDRRNESRCYGECARLWPPVYTKGKPRAAAGARKSLLGTTRRRDGRLQVTYRGQPLYYYAHEGPGEVLCHNVNLNGGLWWVVAPDGKRRP
jgi:predicted lipoprotein with Yx(FWY)xxD motif